MMNIVACLPSTAVFAVLLLLGCAVGETAAFPTDFNNHLWTTARCRATCLTKIRNGTASDQSCSRSSTCALCWDMCMQLEDNWNTYSLVCKHSVLCEQGCRTACDVMLHPVKRFTIRGWRLESLPVIDVQLIEGRLRLSWTSPRAPTADDVAPLVFAVFWQAKNGDAIQPLVETADLVFESTNAHIVFGIDKVIVVAVSPSGPVALVQNVLRSKFDDAPSEEPPTDNKTRPAATETVNILLIILATAFFGVFLFVLAVFFCCKKQRHALRRANAIRRKTPVRVRFNIPVTRKVSLSRRVSPFTKELHPANVFSISPMPEVDYYKKNPIFDDSRQLRVHISSPI